MTAPPVVLAYDDLPPGSDIRREHSPLGVRIVVPASEAQHGVDTRRQIMRQALVWGALTSSPLIALGGVIFYALARTNRVEGVVLFYAWGFFGLFCAALVMLLARERQVSLTDDLRIGRRQMTVLVAPPERLLIASVGPFGDENHDLPAGSIRGCHLDRSDMLDNLSRRRRLAHLTLELTNGRSIRLLPGRERTELISVCKLLERTLNLPPQEP